MSGRPLTGTNGDLARPPLRYRRLGGGYRREDVDLQFAELRLTLRAFELELATLRDRTRDLEGQLREARVEVDRFRAQGFELAKAMSSARDRAATIEREGQERAASVVAEAQERASAMVREAEAAVQNLHAEKERVLGEIRGLFARVGESIARAESPAPRPTENGVPGAGSLEELRARVHPPAAPREQYEGVVVLDAGPFEGFDAVAVFERELSRLPIFEDVYVRHVRGGRALIELTLDSAVPLVEELRERLPYTLEIREAEGGRLLVDVAARVTI